jgi:hydroxymethylglutaryl-CoA lyase
VATEDVVHMLACMGYRTGMDFGGLMHAAKLLQQMVAHELPSQVSRAGHRLTRHSPPADFDAIRDRALARDAAR